LTRIYGPILYPYLVTNWKLVWSSSGNSNYAFVIQQVQFYVDKQTNEALKRTVSVISTYPLFKDGSARFTARFP